jgi:hypothetical protein
MSIISKNRIEPVSGTGRAGLKLIKRCYTVMANKTDVLGYIPAAPSYAYYKPSVDDDSIDLGLAEKGGGGTARSPRLELQLKCYAAETPADSHLSYPLKIKNYEDLRDDTVQVPRILVVVLIPDQVEDWLEASEQELVMRRCGYWVSLHGLPSTSNRNTVAVRTAQEQCFHPGLLRAIMQRIGQGGLP